MGKTDLHNLMETLNREDILICFSGPFSHSIIEELGTAVKHYLEEEQVTKTSMMSVFSIFIEQTQNVRNYAKGKIGQERFFGNGIIVIGKERDNYIINSGNYIAVADAELLASRLRRLIALDRIGLKAAYKEQLRAEPSANGSAGLGLIQMARTASAPLDFTIKKIDDEIAFFSLRAAI